MSSSSAMPIGPVPSLTSTALIAIATIFPILSLISILVRYKARSVGRLALQADDWWIVATWVITFGLSVNAWVFGSITGIDHYKIDPLKGAMKSAQCLYILGLFLSTSLATVKISILCFYKRIFITPIFATISWTGIGLVTVWGIVFFFIGIFQVNPVSGAWTGQGSLNVDTTAFGLAQAGSSIGLDIVVLCFPLPVLYTLRMQTKRKVIVATIFWLGGFCCIAAIVRLVLLKQALAAVTNSKSSSGYDAIYLEAKSYIFAIIEPNCSIIAASLPCYGPLFAGGRTPESLVRSVRSIFSLRSRSSQNSNGSAGSRSQPKAQYGPQGRPNHDSETESQVELNTVFHGYPEYPQHGGNIVNVEPLPHGAGSGGDLKVFQGEGIGVTRTYETKQETV